MGGRGSGGRNRKSAARKKLEGNAGKRKARAKPKSKPPAVPYTSGPLGPPPAHLKDSQKSVWNELSSLVPPGVVEASDRWAFELLVCLMSKFRRGLATSGEVNQISSQLARFGMTPADRDRVPRTPPPNKADAWSDFGLQPTQ